MRNSKTNWLTTALLTIGSFFVLFPLYLTITIAFKTPLELAQNSILALPESWSLQNFATAIEMTDFFRALANSLLITIPTVILTILFHSIISYVIARNLHKKVYKFIYFYIISAMFVPFSIIMLPIVKQTASWNMDNLGGLIVLYLVLNLAFNLFIYTGYIKSIPIELEEAAIIDGATTWQVFWKVIFPLLKPINATIAIITTLSVWNDFMLPLVVLSGKNEAATLPLTQYIFQSEFSTDYTLSFASYLLSMLPMLVLYFIAQKRIISGVTRGAIK